MIGGSVGALTVALLAGSRENERIREVREQMGQQYAAGYRAGWNGGVCAMEDRIALQHATPRGEIRCGAEDLRECTTELLKI